jgi:signal transduction histidine kinase
LDDEGNVFQMIEYSLDITDRKTAEEKLADLAKFPDEDPSPVLRISNKCTVLYKNRAVDILLKKAGLSENNILKILPSDLKELVDRSFETGNPTYDLEVEVADKIYSYSMSPVIESGYVNLYARDVSGTKEAEEELNRTLVEAIKSREIVTSMLDDNNQIREALENKLKELKDTQNMLVQSQKLESIGTMANGIAHNFNTILGAIRGFVEMALADIPPDTRISSDLNRAVEGIEDANELSKKMLLFGRRQEKSLELVEIDPIIKESIDMFKASMTMSIKIDQKINAVRAVVLANANEIKQVIMNLCINAHHAIEGDGGKIEIRCDEVEVDHAMTLKHAKLHIGKYVHIAIRDTGHGMDQATMDRMFEPFFTTKEVGKGTGLGLSVIHGIVMSHNGEIFADSQKGKGTTIHVYLPVTDNNRKNKKAA